MTTIQPAWAAPLEAFTPQQKNKHYQENEVLGDVANSTGSECNTTHHKYKSQVCNNLSDSMHVLTINKTCYFITML